MNDQVFALKPNKRNVKLSMQLIIVVLENVILKLHDHSEAVLISRA